jgi:putative endonuclease
MSVRRRLCSNSDEVKMTGKSSGRIRLGAIGENLACEALRRRGYEIAQRNWRCRHGEIDIVARDGECWVFIEVKTRRGRAAGLPEEGLTPAKAERLAQLAEMYMAEHEIADANWRIDLVAVEMDGRGRVRRLNVIHAVGAD